MNESVRKIVIPAAGSGTRLLPATKEIPKEMMPLFFKDKNNIIVKPLIQKLYEQYFSLGIRDYCFIVGKQKRSIEDHFTPNNDLLTNLSSTNKTKKELNIFYSKLKKSKIFWVNQYEPKGFGDAVLCAESFVGNDDFIVSAGDTLIQSDKLILDKVFNSKLNGKNDAVLLLKEVSDPRRFGVATLKKNKNEFIVNNVEEKPKKPKSNLSIVAVYRFRPSIFDALKQIKKNKNELQLTDGIQKLIEQKGKIKAVLLDPKDNVIDIGTPESYLEAIKNFNP
jgi:UTP--glucose-1-phosphate uridylyltransferase